MLRKAPADPRRMSQRECGVAMTSLEFSSVGWQVWLKCYNNYCLYCTLHGNMVVVYNYWTNVKPSTSI